MLQNIQIENSLKAWIIWLFIFIVCVQTTWGATNNRTMSECYAAGVKCGRYGACYFDTVKNNHTCQCVMGYAGDLCDEDVNECERGSAPCLKRGVCHNFMGGFRCDCLPGWKDSHCQHPDGSGLGSCLSGYTGANCTEDVDECTQWSDNPCEHGSTCVNTPGNFSCSCAAGWEGRICNQDIDECNITAGLCNNGGNCTNTPGSYKCVCPYPLDGYTGSNCTEDIDECVEGNPCENNATCTNTKGNFTCGCTSGWEGHTCNKDINECSLTSGLCHNGGTCTNTPGAYNCVCPYPYTGITCDDVHTTTSAPTTPGLSISSNTPTVKPGGTASISIATSMPSSSIVPGPASGLPGGTPASASVKSTSKVPATSSAAASSTQQPTSTSGISGLVLSTTVLAGASTNQSSLSNVTSPQSNSSKQIGSNGDSSGSDGGGGSNVGVIAGPVVGLLLIAAAVGAGILVYNKYYRKNSKVDAADESNVEKAEKQASSNDTNKNTKFKPPTQNSPPTTDVNPVVNGVNGDAIP